MNVRVFIDWFLPAYKAGGPVQTTANLVGQTIPGVSYSVICSNRDLNGEPIAVKKDQWTKWNSWTSVFYSSTGTRSELLGKEEEVVFINGIYSWEYNLKPILLSKARRKIVSARGMLHGGALSQKAFKKKLYLYLWKAAGLHRKVEFHAVDRLEESAIRKAFGNTVKIHLASNLPRVFRRQPVGEKRRGELELVSIALISPMKNIRSVLQALKGVSELVHYRIYGPVKEEAYWQSCLQLIKTLPPNIRVSYHGDVHPERVEEALKGGQVFVLPSKSENFGHAIYEALSAGKPVITSHYTPWNDLHKRTAGVNVSMENELELSEAIRHFAAMSSEELEEWSKGAKAYSESAIDLEEIKVQYRTMFGLTEGRIESLQRTPTLNQ